MKGEAEWRGGKGRCYGSTVGGVKDETGEVGVNYGNAGEEECATREEGGEERAWGEG